MATEPVEIDIIINQNVDSEGEKATRAIDALASASREAQEQSYEAFKMRGAVVARLRRELGPLEKAWERVNIGTQDPKILEERRKLSPIIKELRSELAGEEKALSEIIKKNEQLAQKQTTLLTAMRDVKNEMAEMKLAGQGETAMYREKEEQLRTLATAHRELTQEQKLLSQGGASMQGFLSGLTALSGLLSAGGGAIGLFNAQSEEYAKIQTRVQSLMAITIGLQQVQNTLHQTSAFRIQTVTRAQQMWAAANVKVATTLGISNVAAKALMGTLTLGLSVAIGGIIAISSKLIAKQREIKEEQQRLADSVATAANTQMVSYEKLRVSYNKLGDDVQAKEKFINDNQDAFRQLGVAIEGVNDADNLFITNTEAFKSAIMERAKATAAMEMAAEEYKEAMKLRQQAEQIKPSRWVANVYDIDENGRPVVKARKAVNLENKAQQKDSAGDKLIGQAVDHENKALQELENAGIKAAEKTVKAVKTATDNTEKEYDKALERLAKMSGAMEKEVDAATIAAMQDGLAKKLAQIDSEYNARKQLIAERLAEIAEIERTHGIDAGKQKQQLEALAEAEENKYNAATAAATAGAQAALDGVWNEINNRFMTENQRRLADINTFYGEQISKARENGATQMEIDQMTADHQRDLELEKQHIALESLDFELMISLKRADIEDRRVQLFADREEKILRLQIEGAKNRLKKLEEIQESGGDVAKDIEQVTVEIEAMNDALNRIPARKLQELANYSQQLLDGLSGFADSLGSDMGDLFDIASGAVGGIASLGAGIASGNPQQIIDGAMKMLDTVGKVIKANKEANEEIRKFNLSLAQQAIDYSLAVIRSIKGVKSETDSIFSSDYSNTLTQGMAGYTAAIDKQAELMHKLGSATVKTGVQKKKFLGITYGTRDVYSSLLKTYPELIKQDGTLNRELAETLKTSGNLKEETSQLIDNILQASDAANEAMQAVESELQNLVGSIGSELKDALDDAFASGTDSAKTMTDNVVKLLKDLGTQKLFNAVFGGLFAELEDKMKDSYSADGDGDLSDDINWFLSEYGKHVEDYNKGLEQLQAAIKEQHGVDPFGDNERTAVAQGIARASQDSVDELNGRITFLVMKVSDIVALNSDGNNSAREQLLITQAMLGHLEVIAENSTFLQHLVDIRSDIDRMVRDGINIKR